MRKMAQLRILAMGAASLSAFAACGTGSSFTVTRGDPNYDNFSEGYNYKDGKSYLCNYQDKTVLKEVGKAQAPVTAVRAEVAPGVHDTNRVSIAENAKEAAIARLRASVPVIRQIGSCDLDCVEDSSRNMYDEEASPTAAAGPNKKGGSSEDGASEASTTNNQVAGVDEADFIKNDNKYMYVVANGQLTIIDAWPAASAKTLATVKLTKGTPTQLLLGSDRLIVYSAVGASASSAGARSGACTYGFDCVPTGDGSATHVTVFDITNRAAPVVLRELDFSGSLIAARKVGDAVHSVLYDAPFEEKVRALSQPPALGQRCYDRRDDVDKAAAELTRMVDEKAAQILAISEAGPALTDSGASVEPTFRASNVAGSSFLSVASFGIGGQGLKAETVLSKPGFVYASSSALYVSVPHEKASENDWYSGYGNMARASEIYKFSIGASASQTQFQATGLVKGSVLNQFAMDEWGGNLRIATTTGRTPDPNVHSTVTILEQNGGNLTQKGILDNIAPTEDIRSVRFQEDRGFVVTFKKTDPLFAIDLANPALPVLTGELKIPGFSTYMHFIDRTHILALGLEADDHGSFAFFNGIQIQIFDVADMGNPKLMHKTVIGTRGSNSEALTNHLGFNYFAPKSLLALPMTVCEGGGNGTYGNNLTFNGLLVFDASVAGGIAKRGGIAHELDANVTCNNWWTQQSSSVKRSVIMDDFVYSVAEDVVKVAGLADLAHPVASLSLK